MTIERAIMEIEQSGLYGNQVHQETLELALAALREKQERENPAPLTLEELLAITEPTRLWSVGDHEPFYSLVEWIDTPYGRKLHWISLDGGEEFIPEKLVRELCSGPRLRYYRRKPEQEG